MATFSRLLLVALLSSLFSGALSQKKVFTVSTFAELEAVVGAPKDSSFSNTVDLDDVIITQPIVFTGPLTITGAFRIMAQPGSNAVFDLSQVTNEDALLYEGLTTRETIFSGITFTGRSTATNAVVPRTAPCVAITRGLVKFIDSRITRCKDSSPKSQGGGLYVTAAGPDALRTKVQFVGNSALTWNSADVGGAFACVGNGAQITFCETETFANSNKFSPNTKDGVVSKGGVVNICYGQRGFSKCNYGTFTAPAVATNDTSKDYTINRRQVQSFDKCPYKECTDFYQQYVLTGKSDPCVPTPTTRKLL